MVESLNAEPWESVMRRVNLVELADQIITERTISRSPSKLLSEVLSMGGIAETLSLPGSERIPLAAEIFDVFAYPGRETMRNHLEQYLEVVALPRSNLVGQVLPGHILVRRALAEGSLAHLSIVTSAPRKAKELASAGLRAESSRPGLYVEVVESGPFPHSIDDGFARRLADEEGWLSYEQMILRPIPRMVGELAEQTPTSAQVTGGEFGKALKNLQMPADVVNLLKLSPSFRKMAIELDKLYIDIWDSTGTRHRTDVVNAFSDGVVTGGTFKGQRVLNVEPSYTTSSWFRPYSITSPGYYDGIYIEKIAQTDLGKWIEVVAHETAHAFRFAMGQLYRPAVICPLSKKVIADMIQSSLQDEILARQIEARVLTEIQADPKGTPVSRYQASTGSMDQKVIERDLITMDWKGTYLEHFVLNTLIHEALACEKLDQDTVRQKNYKVARIPLEKRKLTDYIIDQKYYDPDSGKLMAFVTRYARLRFIQRVIDARWEEFHQQHSRNPANFDQAKERILKEHASAFFEGVISYTP